jgi:hypothetical protein
MKIDEKFLARHQTLTNELREARNELSAAIGDYNHQIEAAHKELESVVEKYNEKLDDIRAFTEKVAEDLWERIDFGGEETDADIGDMYEAWVDFDPLDFELEDRVEIDGLYDDALERFVSLPKKT